MRRLFLLTLTAAAIASNGAKAQLTRSDNYPFCLLVYGPVSYTDCRYTSLGQCQASASGRGAACFTNPFLVVREPAPRRKRRR